MVLMETILEQLGAPTVWRDQALPASIDCFCMDSRQLQPDQLFFALPGAHNDGHDFLPHVAKVGACAVVQTPNPALNLTQWQVDDVVKAMGQLAQAHRAKHASTPLVAITGSCGKTTTSGLVAQMCRHAGKTLASEKSFNNHLGVPLTLSKITPEHQFIVQEMGANHPGEIAYVTAIGQPNVALINMIAPVHLEGFGDLDGVAKAKSEIYQGLQPGGIVVINDDDAYAEQFKQQVGHDHRIVTFSAEKLEATVHLVGAIDYQDKATCFTVSLDGRAYSVCLPLIGQHNVMNALAASACGLALGLSDTSIIQGLQTAPSAAHRLVRHEHSLGYTIFDDSYNANPVAVKMALQALPSASGRQLFVFADMTECGDQAVSFHQQVATDAKASGVDVLYCYGDLTRHTAEAFGAGALFFTDKNTLINALKSDLQAGDQVLIKGSNSMGLTVVSSALLD